MSEGLNRVTLLGNLGADPELRSTAGGQAVLKLRLATSETYLDKDKQRQERTEWHNVVVWGNRATGLAKVLTKGSRILAEGGLRTTSYEKDGAKVYRTEVVAQNILLQGGGPPREPQTGGHSRPMGGGPAAADFPTIDDDLPF